MSDTVENMAVDSREAFGRFVRLLLQDLQTCPEEWENTSLPTFLEALQAYTADIQGFYDNTGRGVDADKPSWQTFADILRGARIYE